MTLKVTRKDIEPGPLFSLETVLNTHRKGLLAECGKMFFPRQGCQIDFKEGSFIVPESIGMTPKCCNLRIGT